MIEELKVTVEIRAKSGEIFTGEFESVSEAGKFVEKTVKTLYGI